MNSRKQDFQQAFRNLSQQPLISPGDRQKFGVSYGEALLPELQQLIEDCTEKNNQIIFAGHRGCGKSTLLAKFAEQIRKDYFTVFFSIADLIETSEINHINILFTIALQLMEEADQQQLKISEDKKRAILTWFAKHTRTETEGFDAEVSLGFDLFSIFKGKLKTDAAVREQITQEFKKNFRDLINAINLIATEIELASQQNIVVIIDDIDKLDLSRIEDIFKGNIKALLEPQFRVIYTIPIATVRDGVLKKHIEDETGNSIYVMPVQKLFKFRERGNHQAQPLASTMEILKEILRKRVNDDLFAPDIPEQIALQSGGVLAELIRLAQECCRLVRVKMIQQPEDQIFIENAQIDEGILTEALDNLRNGMAITLSQDDRQILAKVYSDYYPEDPKQQEFLDLLHTIYVIEYRNKDSWYDVNPLIAEQLRREGKIG
jgi:nucleoside-triphosphatase THEP1